MNYNRIGQVAQQILQAREVIKKNREVWKNVTKPALESIFSILKNEVPFELHYQNNVFGDNKESVIYSLGIAHSGITNTEDGSNTALVKNLGYMIFGQLHNGKIKIMYSKPTIETIVYNKEQYEELGYLKPEELDDDKIYEYFLLFLENILDWEKQSPTGNPIGFSIPQTQIFL